MATRPGAREAVQWLPARLLDAARSVTPSWVDLVDERRPTWVVGSGGSRPSAEFIARVIRSRDGFAHGGYPRDISGRCARLVAVSYSGGTPDARSAITWAKAQGAEVTLVTGAHNASLAELCDAVLVHRHLEQDGQPASELERGFISFAGTAAPCVTAAVGAYGARAVVDCLANVHAWGTGVTAEQLAEQLCELDTFEIVGSGFSWPAALDVESKWTEAALGQLRLHEAKDSSHGRYQSMLSTDRCDTHTLVLRTGAGPYDEVLEEVLATYSNHHVMSAPYDGALGGLWLIVASQYLAELVGSLRGQDISRPTSINPGGTRLYEWDDA